MKKQPQKGWISEQLCVQAAGTCNLYCACCQNPPAGKVPALAPALAAVRRRKIKAVSLEGGGEPTTNPRFFDTVKELRAAGVKSFMLSTNAVALADKVFCKRAAAEIDHFTVNFPSHLPDVYARATRSVKFPLALRGLRNLKACGAAGRTRLFHIVSAHNCAELPAFADWAAGNFPEAALVNLTFVRNAGRVNDSAAIVPRYSAAAPFIKLALAKFKGRHESRNTEFPPLPVARLRGVLLRVPPLAPGGQGLRGRRGRAGPLRRLRPLLPQARLLRRPQGLRPYPRPLRTQILGENPLLDKTRKVLN